MSKAFDLLQSMDTHEVAILFPGGQRFLSRGDALDLADALTKWACTVSS